MPNGFQHTAGDTVWYVIEDDDTDAWMACDAAVEVGQ